MTYRERFERCCRYEDVDRPPMDYLANPAADAAVQSYLGVESERELLDALDCDFYYYSVRDISQNEGFLKCYKGKLPEITDTHRVCPLGIRWHRQAGISKFAVDEAVTAPLSDVTSGKEVLKHTFPKAGDFDFSPLIEEYEAFGERVMIGGLWSGIMGDSYRLYGFENFLLGLSLEPEILHTLIDRVTEMYLELNDALFSAMKGKLDVYFFGNDFGSQQSLLMSPEMWGDYFLKNTKALCKLAKSYGLRIMMHSCGAITDIIPPLIDAGVDILDPIQPTAAGMSAEELKDRFGGRIIFHGGIDTQHILPQGSARNVSDEALRYCRLLGKKGGYILAPSQIFQGDIPPENIVAMYKAGKEAFL